MSRPGVPKTAWGKPGIQSDPGASAASPARETLQQVRGKNPPVFKVSQNQEAWEQRYDREEAAIEQAEAESILESRKDQLQAMKDELLVRRINRRIALGFGATGVSLLRTLDKTAKVLETKITEGADKMSTKELRDTIQVLSGAVGSSQRAIEAMAKTERYMERHPLTEAASDQDDLDDLSTEQAQLLLTNLAKSLGHITKHQKAIDVEGIVTEAEKVLAE